MTYAFGLNEKSENLKTNTDKNIDEQYQSMTS